MERPIQRLTCSDYASVRDDEGRDSLTQIVIQRGEVASQLFTEFFAFGQAEFSKSAQARQCRLSSGRPRVSARTTIFALVRLYPDAIIRYVESGRRPPRKTCTESTKNSLKKTAFFMEYNQVGQRTQKPPGDLRKFSKGNLLTVLTPLPQISDDIRAFKVLDKNKERIRKINTFLIPPVRKSMLCY